MGHGNWGIGAIKNESSMRHGVNGGKLLKIIQTQKSRLIKTLLFHKG